MPLISIIVTVYNIEKYIAECLDSTLRQDFNDYEVVVVDNGSTDRSIEICREYQKKFPDKIRFIELGQPTIVGRAHQTGLDSARGEYCHFVDGDDMVKANYLNDVYSAIKENSPDLIMGSFIGIAEEGAPLFSDINYDYKMINKSSYDEVLEYLTNIANFPMVFWKYIFKKSLFENKVLFEPAIKQLYSFYMTDWIITTDFFISAKSLTMLSRPIYIHRRHNNSILTSAMENFKLTRMSEYYVFNQYLTLLSERQLSQQKKRFIISKMIAVLKTMLGSSDMQSKEEWKGHIELFPIDKEGLEELKLSEEDMLNRLYSFFIKYSIADGFIEFFMHERCNIIKKIFDMNAKYVYIFPCGKLNRGIAKWLCDAKTNINGFLDNNPNLDNILIDDKICCMPKFLSQLSAEELEQSLIVISTIYPKLSDMLMQQCIDMGINPYNIIFI